MSTVGIRISEKQYHIDIFHQLKHEW